MPNVAWLTRVLSSIFQGSVVYGQAHTRAHLNHLWSIDLELLGERRQDIQDFDTQEFCQLERGFRIYSTFYLYSSWEHA